MREGYKRSVSGFVTKGVVDLLEPVDVHHHHRHVPLVAFAFFHFQKPDLEKSPSVFQAGEGVGSGQHVGIAHGDLEIPRALRHLLLQFGLGLALGFQDCILRLGLFLSEQVNAIGKQKREENGLDDDAYEIGVASDEIVGQRLDEQKGGHRGGEQEGSRGDHEKLGRGGMIGLGYDANRQKEYAGDQYQGGLNEQRVLQPKGQPQADPADVKGDEELDGLVRPGYALGGLQHQTGKKEKRHRHHIHRIEHPATQLAVKPEMLHGEAGLGRYVYGRAENIYDVVDVFHGF